LGYITPICRNHGPFRVRADGFINDRQGCRKCQYEDISKNQTKTQEQYIADCISVWGDKYILDKVVYTGNRNKIKPICRIHGEWETQAGSFIKEHGCPSCNESKGEKLIAKILDENGIVYERQKRYKDCRGKRLPLPFDFYIPSINTLIEFDGKQHFIPCVMFGGEYALLETQRLDTIKTNYCLSRGIPLVRVSYTMNEDEVRATILRITAA
jgi:hypothetical protein